MDIMDTNMYWAEYYLARLNNLNDTTRLYILKKLADSLLKDKEPASRKEKDAALLDKINGAWADDGSCISDSFARQAKEEIDRLWESDELNEEKVEGFRQLHERTPYKE